MYYNAQQIEARVRLLRKQRGMSQNEFAEMIGISRIYVAKIEAGMVRLGWLQPIISLRDMF